MKARTQPQAASQQDWQAANDHYLRLALERLRLLLSVRALWLRSQWRHDPRQEAVAQVISDAHLEWLCRGEDVEAVVRFAATNAESRAVADEVARVEAGLNTLLAQMGRQAPALEVLAHLFRLSSVECDVLLLCLAPELDPTFGPLMAYVQDDMARPWPTMHLAFALAGGDPARRAELFAALSEAGTLRRDRLIHAAMDAAPGMPASLRPLTVDERIVDYVRGVNHPDQRLAPALAEVRGGSLTADQQDTVERLAARMSEKRSGAGRAPLINLVGPPDSGQEEMTHALAVRLGLTLLRLDLIQLTGEAKPLHLSALVEREGLLLQAGFFVQLPPYTQENALSPLLTSLARRRRLCMIVASADPLPEQDAITVRITPPDPKARLDLWRRSLGADAERMNGVLPALVEQFTFGSQTIQRVTGQARAACQLDGEPFTSAALWAASRDASGGELAELAQRLAPFFAWRDLVVAPDVLAQLHEIADQVMRRYQVYEEWGYGPSLARGRGVTALFSGPSGVGKTMAAEVLARHLDLALYRIDLSNVVNKYIGETEKNIRRVFDAAERSGAILFFDEADALFGKRTEIRDSHDRFANIEIDYLLQRMESYHGLAILATNRRSALDRAFLRRLRFVVEFTFPDAEARRRIWQKVFPAHAPLDGVDYERLARLEIPGGNIRNIAINASFLAAADGGKITMRHILAAAQREYAKMEKLASETEFGAR
jgi:hypothetical protein